MTNEEIIAGFAREFSESTFITRPFTWQRVSQAAGLTQKDMRSILRRYDRYPDRYLDDIDVLIISLHSDKAKVRQVVNSFALKILRSVLCVEKRNDLRGLCEDMLGVIRKYVPEEVTDDYTI